LNRSFKQVDVFTSTRFKGNPVAVVLRADGLTTAQMQQIANWTNLSETTFVLPPTDSAADYRVRIFTPNSELPFAGHPTIGTAHALLEVGSIQAQNGVLVQQCGAGLIRLQVNREPDGTQWIAFELPQPGLSPLDEAQRQELAGLLGCALKPGVVPQVVDVGPRWQVVQLPNAQAVLAAKPDLLRMEIHDRANGYTGVVIFGEYLEPAAPARIEVRAFAPAFGVDEDPVCGSGNAAVAAFISGTGQVPHFGCELLSAQGAIMGREGLLRLSLGHDSIRVGGHAITCIEGEIRI
jgi:PhzF family phenazine biosynthesis protein